MQTITKFNKGMETKWENYSEIGDNSNENIIQQGDNNIAIIINKYLGTYNPKSPKPFHFLNLEFLNEIKSFHLIQPEKYTYINFYSNPSDFYLQWWGLLNHAIAHREIEKEILTSCTNGLLNSEPILMWIEGSGGMGKSTLLKSLTNTLINENNFTVCWINAKNWNEFQEFHKFNFQEFNKTDIFCIDQVDSEEIKQLIINWIERIDLKTTKVIISGRLIQGIPLNILVNGWKSIINIDEHIVEKDNLNLIEKILSNVKEWNNVKEIQNITKIKPVQIIFILKRNPKTGMTIGSFEEIIQHDLKLLAQDNLYWGFKDSLSTLACIYLETGINYSISKKAFLKLTNHFQNSNILKNLEILPISVWDRASILQSYLIVDSLNESIIFNHDLFIETIGNIYKKDFIRRRKGVYEFLNLETDDFTSSRFIFNSWKYSNLFSSDEILAFIKYQINRKNSHHTYLTILTRTNFEISDEERDKLFIEYFKFCPSNNYLCSSINYWLDTKSKDFKVKWIVKAVEEWGASSIIFLPQYLGSLSNNAHQIQKTIEFLNHHDRDVIIYCLKILDKNKVSSILEERIPIILESTENPSLIKICLSILYKNTLLPSFLSLKLEYYIKNSDNWEIISIALFYLNKLKNSESSLIERILFFIDKYKQEYILIECLKFLQINNFNHKKYITIVEQLFTENFNNSTLVNFLLNNLKHNNYSLLKLRKIAFMVLDQSEVSNLSISSLKILFEDGLLSQRKLNNYINIVAEKQDYSFRVPVLEYCLKLISPAKISTTVVIKILDNCTSYRLFITCIQVLKKKDYNPSKLDKIVINLLINSKKESIIQACLENLTNRIQDAGNFKIDINKIRKLITESVNCKTIEFLLGFIEKNKYDKETLIKLAVLTLETHPSHIVSVKKSLTILEKNNYFDLLNCTVKYLECTEFVCVKSLEILSKAKYCTPLYLKRAFNVLRYSKQNDYAKKIALEILIQNNYESFEYYKELLYILNYIKDSYVLTLCIQALKGSSELNLEIIESVSELLIKSNDSYIITNCLEIISLKGNKLIVKDISLKLLEKHQNRFVVNKVLDTVEKLRINDAVLIDSILKLTFESIEPGVFLKGLHIIENLNINKAQLYATEKINSHNNGIIKDISEDGLSYLKLLTSYNLAQKNVKLFFETTNIEKNFLPVLKTSINVLGNCELTDKLFNLLINDVLWQNAELTKFLSYSGMYKINGWELLIIHILENPLNFNGRIIGNTFSHKKKFSQNIVKTSTFILLNWEQFLENVLLQEDQYSGHIISSLGHPNLRDLAWKTAKKILESNNPFLKSKKGYYLEKHCKNIVNKEIYPIWED